jgi:hypothetical protein
MAMSLARCDLKHEGQGREGEGDLGRKETEAAVATLTV